MVSWRHPWCWSSFASSREAAPEHARHCCYYMLFAIWPVLQKTHSRLPTGFSTTRREDRKSSHLKLEAVSVRDWLDSSQTEPKIRVCGWNSFDPPSSSWR